MHRYVDFCAPDGLESIRLERGMSEELEGPYAIHRLGKVKRNALGQTHAARSENGTRPTHLFPENPPPEVLLNTAPRGKNFVDFVLEKYDQAKVEKRVYRPRKDQVFALEGVLTASPEFFRPKAPNVAGLYEIEKVHQIRDRAIPYLRKLYGENLVRVELQLDEVTPHVQYAVLPIDQNGRWSAKNCMSRSALRNLWDSWSFATKDLGLKRGNPEMIGDHIPVREFYFAADQFKKFKNDTEKKIRLPHYEIDVPSRASLLNPQKLARDINAGLATWVDEQSSVLQKRLAPLLAAVAEQKIKNRRASQYRVSALKHEKQNRALEERLKELTTKLQRHEPVSLADVAKKLGLTAFPKALQSEDAVGFLIASKNVSEDEAFGWILSEFGENRAAATAAALERSRFIARASRLPKLSGRNFGKIRSEIEEQLSALDADYFRIHYKSHANETAQLMLQAKPKGKSTDWTLDDVLANLPAIKKLSDNHEIQVLPFSSKYNYLLVAGARSESMFSDFRYKPCVTLRLGLKKFEAVLRCPIGIVKAKTEVSIDEYAASLRLAIYSVDRGEAIPLAGSRTVDNDKKGKIVGRVGLVSAVDVDAFPTPGTTNRPKYES